MSARRQLAQVRQVGCDGFPCHDPHMTPPPAADVRPIRINADDAATAHQLPPPRLPPLTAACRVVDHGIGHPVALRQRWHYLSAHQRRSTYLNRIKPSSHSGNSGSDGVLTVQARTKALGSKSILLDLL
jgi:hypothetical protein